MKLVKPGDSSGLSGEWPYHFPLEVSSGSPGRVRSVFLSLSPSPPQHYIFTPITGRRLYYKSTHLLRVLIHLLRAGAVVFIGSPVDPCTCLNVPELQALCTRPWGLASPRWVSPAIDIDAPVPQV